MQENFPTDLPTGQCNAEMESENRRNENILYRITPVYMHVNDTHTHTQQEQRL